MLIHNAEIITPEGRHHGYVVTSGAFITTVGYGDVPGEILQSISANECIDLQGKWLMAGVIDDQVHFREPGLTHKADIASESRAAAAGGVTSFMDMPNTKPLTTTVDAWKEKMEIGARSSIINYSFFLGATNTNIDEIRSADFSKIPGIKVFMGSSTGNMLVNDSAALTEIFSLPYLIAIHSEDEDIINANKEKWRAMYPDGVPMKCHSDIRSGEACMACTKKAVDLAQRLGTRLHVFHVSTAGELDLIASASENITSEVCVHHLLFTTADYDTYGWKIKWNPAVKNESDRDRLLKGLMDNSITVIATDHAPHLESEKQGDALTAASGGPSVQYSLLFMLKLASEGYLTPERVTWLMSASPAKLYGIIGRGEIREGYYADLVVIDPAEPTIVDRDTILSKCKWSPFEGWTFPHSVDMTIVNGRIVYTHDKGIISDVEAALPLEFKISPQNLR